MNVYVIVDPHAATAAINLLVENRMNSNVSLEWQQQGKRKSLLIKGDSIRYADIVFNVEYGISPVVLRGYTADKKRFPVKINGALGRSFTPVIRRTLWRLVIEKAVKNYYIMFMVHNLANDAIDVMWLEDGKQQILTVPFKGKAGRAVSFQDRLYVTPVTFEAVLKGTKERVTLNKEIQLRVEPQAFINRRIFVAEKDYFITVNVKNQVAEDIEVRYKQSGVTRSFVVDKGDQMTQDLIFSGPNAKEIVEFDAVSMEGNVSVKLNNLDAVTVAPDFEKRTSNLVAEMRYYLILKFENFVEGEVVIKWESENGEEKSIELGPKNGSVVELHYQGVNADRPVTLHAKLKNFDKIIQLNGMNNLTVRPKPFMETITVRVTEKYYINVEIKNDAARGVVLTWNMDNNRRTLDVAKGATKSMEIVLDGGESLSPVDFQAFIEDTEVLASLNGKGKVSLNPLRRRKVVQINASKYFYIDIEVMNRVGEPIEIIWKEEGYDKSQVIGPRNASLVSIVTTGMHADKRVEFSATLKGRKGIVELDEKRTVTFTPQMKRSPVRVIAAAYRIIFINYASGSVLLKWKAGRNLTSLRIPSKSTKEQYLIFDASTDSLNLSGINERRKTPVLINGTKEFKLFKDSRRLTIKVIIMDGMCKIF